MEGGEGCCWIREVMEGWGEVVLVWLVKRGATSMVTGESFMVWMVGRRLGMEEDFVWSMKEGVWKKGAGWRLYIWRTDRVYNVIVSPHRESDQAA